MAPDPVFGHPRLVAVYDVFDGHRADLGHYLTIAEELGARTILDVGCGTGCFACLLSERGYDVVGCDPPRASLDAARRKPHADRVRWISGDAEAFPLLQADLAVMTGNVAQVFLTDAAWMKTLAALHAATAPDGFLVFEVRDPARRAWLDWTPDATRSRHDVQGIGPFEGWCDVMRVAGEYVHFRWTYVFESDGEVLTSDSTLRFRDKAAILRSLDQANFDVVEVRDAPDRPGQEFVFIAQRRPS